MPLQGKKVLIVVCVCLKGIFLSSIVPSMIMVYPSDNRDAFKRYLVRPRMCSGSDYECVPFLIDNIAPQVHLMEARNWFSDL
jgi:hypothetical protein